MSSLNYNLQMNITLWRCTAQSTGECNENIEHFFEVLPCERYHRDLNGPWAMLSSGMSYHAKCGANAVNIPNLTHFNLEKKS